MAWNPKRPFVKPKQLTADTYFIRFDNTPLYDGVIVSECALPLLTYAFLLKTAAGTVEVRYSGWKRSRPLEYHWFARCPPDGIEFLDGNKLNWDVDNLKVRGEQVTKEDWPDSPPLLI